MNEPDALVERLKARALLQPNRIEAAACIETEAADRIESLSAEVDRLREEIMQIEVDAMEHYNDWMEYGCEPVEAARFAFDLGQYAREALEGTSDAE